MVSMELKYLLLFEVLVLKSHLFGTQGPFQGEILPQSRHTSCVLLSFRVPLQAYKQFSLYYLRLGSSIVVLKIKLKSYLALESFLNFNFVNFHSA